MEMEDAVAVLAALGTVPRLQVVRILAAAPDGLAAGEIAARLALAPSTLSFHLRALEQAGLIAAARFGRSLVYVLRPARLAAALAFLAACGGLVGLQAPDAAHRGESRMSGPRPFHVLFLCTRNSARSIMAEAILGRLAPGRFVAHSAGSAPAPEGPMPEVLAQLKALGHDVGALRSKSWDGFAGADAPAMDFVITLCDTVTGQQCPEFRGMLVTAAWPLPDPAKFIGSAAERATLLNELYAGLRRRLEIFISLPIASLDRLALKAQIDALASPHPAA